MDPRLTVEVVTPSPWAACQRDSVPASMRAAASIRPGSTTRLRGPRQPPSQSRLQLVVHEGQATTGSSPLQMIRGRGEGGSGVPSGPRGGLVLGDPRGHGAHCRACSGHPAGGVGERVASTRTGGVRSDACGSTGGKQAAKWALEHCRMGLEWSVYGARMRDTEGRFRSGEDDS
jgi:hypothetical protein